MQSEAPAERLTSPFGGAIVTRAGKRLAGLERGARPLVVLAHETMKDANEAYRRNVMTSHSASSR
jgi:hypothetical protein